MPTFGEDSTKIFINGFSFDKQSQQVTKAIRLQGIADFFFKKKSYAQSLPYYEQALEILPKEADITFRLAELYQHEKLWLLSELYYKQTIDLLKEEVNFEKSQLNGYISRIRIAKLYHLQNNPEKSRSLIQEVRREASVIESTYPKAWEELLEFEKIYPSIAIRERGK